MARIRSIKPEIATSSQVVACCRDARLLFILLWPFCDDGGVHPADPLRTKMECFPGDVEVSAEDVERWAGELLAQGLLAGFEAEGRRWWKVTGWAKHQRVDRPSFRYPQSGAPVTSPPESPLGAVARATGERGNDGAAGSPLKPLTATSPGLEPQQAPLAESSANARPTSGEDAPPEGKGGEGSGASSLAALGTHPPEGGPPAAARAETADRKPGIVSTWNELARQIGCPTVAKLSNGRRRKLTVRLNDPEFRWPAILEAAREAKGAHGKAWFTFDFLIENDTNYLKLLEGKYREAIGPPGGARGGGVHTPAEHPGDFQ